jgi:lysozyme family protein
MAKLAFSESLRVEYQRLFDSCQINQSRLPAVEKLAGALIKNRPRYNAAADPLTIPWYVVAAIHSMECSQNFSQHLHNGDPLTARTTHVPAGRPVEGNPPFTWEQSAADALRLKRFDQWNDWTIPGILYQLEGYNGWGYRLYHPETRSPYLWSYSNLYRSGKYTADGTWSNSAVSNQCGAATLLRRLAEKGELAAQPHIPDVDLAKAMNGRAALFRYSPSEVVPGGIELQRFLNQFPGIYLREDGKLGRKTSAAYKSIFGRYLLSDPRGEE